MIKCPYCGRNNPEGALLCSECATSLADNPPEPWRLRDEFLAAARKPLPAIVKNALWWGIAIAAWLYIAPGAIVYLPFFTIGLAGEGVLAIGLWVFYIAATIAALRARTRWVYFSIYVPFCVLLLMNAAGCKRIADDLSQLQ